MKISFDNSAKVSGVLTMTIEKADYQAEVEKTLKDYRKKAQIPGFRPGNAPMGMIQRQYGDAVKFDVVNKMIGEKLYAYIQENNIQMLGEPLPNAAQVEQDIKKSDDLTFVFDIAIAPEVAVELSNKDKVDYYDFQVEDKMIDQQVEQYAARMGHYDKAEQYDAEQRDMLKGDMRELDADGNAKEDGIVVEGAVMMPEYIKVDDQKKLFDGSKPGDIITFNPKKAYPENNTEVASLLKIEKEQAENLTSDFTFQVIEVQRFVKGEVNQQLFDSVFGEGACKDEAEFRQKIAEGIKGQLSSEADYKFLADVRAYLEKKVGEVKYDDDLMKRIMQNNNKDKDASYVEENYEGSIKELTWHLMKEQLVKANEIKVDDNDVKAVAKGMARMQFAQYGMTNVPDEYLENYAESMLKDRKNVDGIVDRAIDQKLIDALKNVVKLNMKQITVEEYNKMMSGK